MYRQEGAITVAIKREKIISDSTPILSVDDLAIFSVDNGGTANASIYLPARQCGRQAGPAGSNTHASPIYVQLSPQKVHVSALRLLATV